MAYEVGMNSRGANSLLTVSEAAEFLHVHNNTLRRWSDTGLLTSYRICSRGDRRFAREDLMHFLDNYNAFKE